MSKFILLALLGLSSSFAQEDPDKSKNQPNTSSSSGVDILLLDSQLSLLYQRGPYLVYDCQNTHWVCTAEPEFLRCKNERKEFIADKLRSLPCAPIKKFDSEIDCQLKQQELTDSGYENNFCINDKVIDEFGKY